MLARPGVGFVIDLSEFILAELGVDLRCRNIRMTQQSLDLVHISAAVQKMGGQRSAATYAASQGH